MPEYQRARSDMKQLLLALQFLTIIPLDVKGDLSEEEMSRSTIFFPAAGALQGLLAVAVAYLFAKYLGVEVATVMVLAALALSNGGLHIDGLADTFDAIAVKADIYEAKTFAKRLSVMKDSATGPIGVAAVVFIILLKFILIKGLFLNLPRQIFYSFLFLMPVFSKWAMVPPMHHGVSARKDGLGRVFIQNIEPGANLLSLLLTALLSMSVFMLWLRNKYTFKGLILFVVIFAVLYLFGLVSAKYCRGKFGGLTGDNFGAISEIAEIIFLMAVSAW